MVRSLYTVLGVSNNFDFLFFGIARELFFAFRIREHFSSDFFLLIKNMQNKKKSWMQRKKLNNSG